MMRFQVQLEPAQHRQLKQRAMRLGVSVSELVRRCVAAELAGSSRGEQDDRVRRALAVAGKYDDPRRSDTATHHDAALADAYR